MYRTLLCREGKLETEAQVRRTFLTRSLAHELDLTSGKVYKRPVTSEWDVFPRSKNIFGGLLALPLAL